MEKFLNSLDSVVNNIGWIPIDNHNKDINIKCVRCRKIINSKFDLKWVGNENVSSIVGPLCPKCKENMGNKK